ncbi:DUF3040 domain-containing protein [Streptomyces griseorubiginosus]|uniref:DUF3040 domain-containing protein n=1 Tax=Streptomyces griseorubiginosus TaxID=67304 RepID=UPI0034080820
MATGRLPDHEQRILDEVERALRRDRRLERRMRTHRMRRWPDLSRVTHYRPHVLTVGLLLTVSITLMVLGIVTSRPAVIWTFAALWPLNLFASFRLLCRWTER